MKNIYLFIYLFICIFFLSCSKNVSEFEESDETYGVENSSKENVEGIPEITSEEIIAELTEKAADITFGLKAESNIYYPFLVENGYIHIVVPNAEKLVNVKLLYSEENKIISMKGYYPNYSNFKISNSFTMKNISGEEKNYVIILYDLPVLTIETPDGEPILSSEERKEGCSVKLYTSGNIDDLGTAGIKVRGNSTSTLPKKPYNIKLDSKKSILGMNKSKKWVLLANQYYDRTQLHNATAFEIARLTDYPWVQKGKFVEVILNNEHKGLYYLCEKIDIAKDRINIDELNPSDIDKDKISGGYLFEGDVGGGNYYFQTDYFSTSGTQNWNLYWHLKNPDEEVPDEQLNYIKQSMNKMESLVSKINAEDYNCESEYKDYLDVETAINWYLVEELCVNEEASRTKNCYLYKKRGDNKIYFGPPWDFDAWTFGMAGTQHFYVLDSGYFWSTLFKDEYFLNRLKAKWAAYKNIWKEQIPSFIDEQYSMIQRSAERNEVMWPDWPFFDSSKTYEQVVIDMKNSFNLQLNWMDEQIEKM